MKTKTEVLRCNTERDDGDNSTEKSSTRTWRRKFDAMTSNREKVEEEDISWKSVIGSNIHIEVNKF